MKALLWDMDGTLVDSEPLHEHALAEAMRHYGITPPDGFHEAVLGMGARAAFDWLSAHSSLDVSFSEWIATKYDIYKSGADRIAPIAGALDVWRAAQAAGMPQAIASNSDRIIVDTNLGAVGVTTAGLVSVSINDVREGKPAPEIYQRAAWLLGVDPSDAIVLEDSGTGALAGLRAGATVYMVPDTPAPTPEGAHKLESFDQLRALVSAYEGA